MAEEQAPGAVEVAAGWAWDLEGMEARSRDWKLEGPEEPAPLEGWAALREPVERAARLRVEAPEALELEAEGPAAREAGADGAQGPEVGAGTAQEMEVGLERVQGLAEGEPGQVRALEPGDSEAA